MDKENFLRRIASLKTTEVEIKLPRIHIKSEGSLFQLLVWRNKNKSKVRNINPIVKEGIISTVSKENYFYFLQYDEDNIYLINKVSKDEYVAFVFNIVKSTVTPVANTITFYSKEGAVQDILTVYATTMAYLRELEIEEMKEGDTFIIDNVK